MVVDLPAGQRRKAKERRESEVRKAVHHRKVEHHAHASGGATARKRAQRHPPLLLSQLAACRGVRPGGRKHARTDGRAADAARGMWNRRSNPAVMCPAAMAAASLSAPQHIHGPTATGQPHLKGAVALALTRVDVAADNDRHVILLASGHG